MYVYKPRRGMKRGEESKVSILFLIVLFYPTKSLYSNVSGGNVTDECPFNK